MKKTKVLSKCHATTYYSQFSLRVNFFISYGKSLFILYIDYNNLRLIVVTISYAHLNFVIEIIDYIRGKICIYK